MTTQAPIPHRRNVGSARPGGARSGAVVLPKLTPYQLRGGVECAVAAAADLDEHPGVRSAFLRWRLRDPLIGVLDAAHRKRPFHGVWLANISVPERLEPEEMALWSQALHNYAEMFDGEEMVRVPGLNRTQPTPLANRPYRLGGAMDLVLQHGRTNQREYRHLSLWGRPLPDHPLDAIEVVVPLIRLMSLKAVPLGPVTVRVVDPLVGEQVVAEVDLRAELAVLRKRLDGWLAGVEATVNGPAEPSPGRSCRTCRLSYACDAVPGGPRLDRAASLPDEALTLSQRTRSGALVGEVLTFSPSSWETLARCPRQFRNRHLLTIPTLEESTSAGVGLRVHEVLCALHQRDGACNDRAVVGEFLDDHLGDGPIDRRARQLVERHVARCPTSAEPFAHEHDVVRVEASGWPLVVVTGRLDALWVRRDLGVLEVRDYKTGQPLQVPLSADPSARLQAWLAAPLAEELGLGLRLRYEQLGDEGDESAPWDPDADDLAAIGAELRTAATQLAAGEVDWSTDSATVCEVCDYRPICPVAIDAPQRHQPVAAGPARPPVSTGERRG